MACDHGQPVCARCTERDRADSCTYRTRPFKKKRGHCSYVEPALSQPDPDHGPHVPRNAPQPNISSILYENYIIHSLIDGDQSLVTWRRLGDLISCLLALGYHEEMDSTNSLPGFVTSLRKSAYAYSYTADKNLSIFLGRPPRIHPKFGRFHVAYLNVSGQMENEAQSPLWDATTPFDFQAEAQWSATCAAIKEEVLHPLSESPSEHRSQKLRLTLNEIESRWALLPPHFRLEEKLKLCDRTPLETALLLDVKLNYLHMLFLVRLALMRNILETDNDLFAIAFEMFDLVIEAVMLKDNVAHGSTSLVWKVSYFGLASAGTICLSLLQPSFLAEQHVSVQFKIFQNLAILVAEVESGTLVAPEDANYALLASATQTITSVLQSLLPGRGEQQQQERRHQNCEASPRDLEPQSLTEELHEPWSPWRHSGYQDFELDFWNTLAEHPSLVGDESYPSQV
ncbi:hypothetical protein CGMCC3_g8275 [Colletotrichum fructicola]|uniref:Zn(2)-C6 fungal-type domain-containing protein n=1 Tax=Colletotrichum fructicola (strain Nara gc5) TaxID=1213859 RepID=A0A7J6J6T9_COLFN|nr:uncharacterized protein CGMCC3_g8275 [Colletotrichum fructicola]KAE9575718.1 hypothetical protein CGMCC3_g8275 [Colletotrichum fructicola]KAF4485384.1 hypothetical protein CGGC5_v007235 [Colletotrichum fructicola Nara gc5]